MDWYGRLEWLLTELRQQTVWQNGQIAELRRSLDDLRQSLAEMAGRLSRLEERAPVHVERIDYQFEQLKVERLDGTLVIGLAPGGTGTIEDLALAGTPAGDVAWSETREPAAEEAFGRMRERVRRFLSGEFPALLAERARALGAALPPDRVAAIVEDLEKQVDDRIRLYMARMPVAPDEPATGNAARPEEAGGTGKAGEIGGAGDAGDAGDAAGESEAAGERPGTGTASGPGANETGHVPGRQREDEIVRRVLRDIRNAVPSYLQVFGNGGAHEHDA